MVRAGDKPSGRHYTLTQGDTCAGDCIAAVSIRNEVVAWPWEFSRWSGWAVGHYYNANYKVRVKVPITAPAGATFQVGAALTTDDDQDFNWYPGSTQITATILPLPSAPSDFDATGGVKVANLSWTAANGNGWPIQKYQYRQQQGSGDYGDWIDIPRSAAGEANQASYTVSGLSNGKDYTFRLRAVSEVGAGPRADASARTASVPGGPRNVLGASLDGGALLTWDAPESDGGTPITAYRYSVFCTGCRGDFYTIPNSDADTRSFIVTGLTNGVTYSLYVAAMNAAGLGRWVGGWPEVTPEAIGGSWNYETVVEPSTITAGGGVAAQVKFRAKFQAERGNLTFLSARVTGGGAIGVDAAGRDDNFGWIDEGATVDESISIAPETRWTMAPVAGSACTTDLAAGSMVCEAVFSDNLIYAKSGATSGDYTLETDIEDAFTYTAVVNAGDSTQSAPGDADFPDATLTVLSAGLPATPPGFQATAGVAQVTFTWTDPNDLSITKYQYQQDGGAWTDIPDSAPGDDNEVSYTLTGLTTGVTYSFKLRAMNTLGAGGETGEVRVTPRTVPEAPQSVAAEPLNLSARLSWEAPASDGGSAIIGYEYQVDDQGWQLVPGSNVATRSYDVPGLVNGQSYTLKVRAVNEAGPGADAAASEVTPRTVPEAPQSVAAEPLNLSARLSWEAPASDGGSAIIGYEYQVDDQAWQSVPGSDVATRSYDVPGLVNGQSYALKVRAVNETGPGADAAAPSVRPRIGGTWTYEPEFEPSNTITAGSGVGVRMRLRATFQADQGNLVSLSAGISSGAGIEFYGTNLDEHVGPVGIGNLNDDGIIWPSFKSTGGLGSGSSCDVNLEAGTMFCYSRYVPRSFYAKSTATPGDYTLVTVLDDAFTYTPMVNGVDSTQSTPSSDDFPDATLTVLAWVPVVPAVPTGFRVTAGSGEVTLTWDDPGDASITKYQYQQGGSAWTDIPDSAPGDANEVSHTVPGLDGDTVYTFRLRAVNDVGESDPTAAVVISGSASVDYAESGTGAVVTYSAGDPEGQTDITWSLTGADSSGFSLTGGVLTFLSPPNYEAAGDADFGNDYQVTVSASDPNDNSASLDVTVNVTDVDEAGSVSLNSAQPQVGTELTATLNDEDAGVSNTAWRWAWSSDGVSNWNNIASATSASYTPVDADLNQYLRATATYDDTHGTGKSVQAISTNAVQAAPVSRISFDSAIYSGIEGGPAVGITVNIVPPADRDFTLPISFANGTAESDDYTVDGFDSNGNLRVTAGDRSRTFTITPQPDSDVADETLVLRFGAPLPSRVFTGAIAQTTLTIYEITPIVPTEPEQRVVTILPGVPIAVYPPSDAPGAGGGDVVEFPSGSRPGRPFQVVVDFDADTCVEIPAGQTLVKCVQVDLYDLDGNLLTQVTEVPFVTAIIIMIVHEDAIYVYKRHGGAPWGSPLDECGDAESGECITVESDRIHVNNIMSFSRYAVTKPAESTGTTISRGTVRRRRIAAPTPVATPAPVSPTRVAVRPTPTATLSPTPSAVVQTPAAPVPVTRIAVVPTAVPPTPSSLTDVPPTAAPGATAATTTPAPVAALPTTPEPPATALPAAVTAGGGFPGWLVAAIGAVGLIVAALGYGAYRLLRVE